MPRGCALLLLGALSSCGGPQPAVRESDRLAFIREGDLWILTPDSGTRERVTEGWGLVAIDGLDSRRLLVAAKEEAGFTGLRWDVLSLESKSRSPIGSLLLATLSSDAARVARLDTTRSGRVLVSRTDGKGPSRVLDLGAAVADMSWDPGGERLVVSVADDPPKPPQLRVVDVDSGTSTTVFEGYASRTQWSPNGNWIAFSGRRDDRFGVWTVRPDGTELRRVSSAFVLSHGIVVPAPVWSPDSSRIAFSSTRKDDQFPYRIFRVDRDGAHGRELEGTEKHNLQPSWSPSGRSILFVQADGYGSKDPQLFIMGADGAGARRLMEATPVAWLPSP